MKVSKTDRSNSVSKTAVSSKKSPSTDTDKRVESPPPSDTVNLSAEAIAAAQAEGVQKVESAETTADGPLPDPYETSKKMLEKELKRVFKATYLTDGA